MAPVDDPIRSVWSRWTRSVEAELDRLFEERVGPETRILERARQKAGGDPRFALRIGDATELSEVDGPFDFVVCTWLLSHLEDPGRAVETAIGKLAPGGTAVFVSFTEPDRAVVRWPLQPAVRAFRAHFVAPEPIRGTPGLERIARHGGGIATLAVFRRGEAVVEPVKRAVESQ